MFNDEKRKNPFYKETVFEDKELLEKMFKHYLDLDWKQDTYIINGRSVTPKRKTFMYGKDYSYSGMKQISIPFDEKLSYISREIEKSMNLEKGYFNGCLLNYYEDGLSYISYHKDDEKQMVDDAMIVSLSLGATRKFYLKNDKTKKVEKLIHHQGEILVMEHLTQKEWTHSVPKESKVKEGRISLTFRRFL